MTPKVFCIGFHKTGTKSLAAALEQLGYRVTGPNGSKDPDIALNVQQLVENLVPQFDAFQDNPWPIVFRDLDRRYPGSRFILTVREPRAWLESALGYFGRKPETPMRKWIYGVASPVGNEQIFLERYNRHNRDVLDHFAERPGDLLVMDLAGGDGWEKLCAFLGKPVPAGSFPHAKKAKNRARGSFLSRLFGR